MQNDPNAPNQERDAHTVEGPGGRPPDEGLAYDPEMTEGDEANVPPASDPDPNAEPPPEP